MRRNNRRINIMGAAKRRGTYEERLKQAVIRLSKEREIRIEKQRIKDHEAAMSRMQCIPKKLKKNKILLL